MDHIRVFYDTDHLAASRPEQSPREVEQGYYSSKHYGRTTGPSRNTRDCLQCGVRYNKRLIQSITDFLAIRPKQERRVVYTDVLGRGAR